MNTAFWINNPMVLFNKDKIMEIWPLQNMTIEEKLNGITRLVLILTILGYLTTKNIKIIVTGAITLFSLVLLYKMKMENTLKTNIKDLNIKEGFTNPELYKMLRKNFTEPSVTNPAMNVLLTEIDDNPNRKTAAPCYNKVVENDMNEKTKEFITNNFDDKTNIDERLFKDLGDSFVFDQSMRTWNSTPNTSIPNDQKSFAEYCYGDMISCKEGDEFACTRSAPPHWVN
jgi:hypothetical protein